jgi:hypothetical protein
METQAFKDKEEEPGKTRGGEGQRIIYDTCRGATKPEITMDRLGETQVETQVYNKFLKAISGVKGLSDTIYANYANSEKVPFPFEIAKNLNYAIGGLSGTKSKTEGKA